MFEHHHHKEHFHLSFTFPFDTHLPEWHTEGISHFRLILRNCFRFTYTIPIWFQRSTAMFCNRSNDNWFFVSAATNCTNHYEGVSNEDGYKQLEMSQFEGDKMKNCHWKDGKSHKKRNNLTKTRTKSLLRKLKKHFDSPSKKQQKEQNHCGIWRALKKKTSSKKGKTNAEFKLKLANGPFQLLNCTWAAKMSSSTMKFNLRHSKKNHVQTLGKRN